MKFHVKIIALLVFLFFYSCGKNEVEIQKINTQIQVLNSVSNSTLNNTIAKNVYVTGYIGYYEGGASGALAWRNGLCSILFDNGTSRSTCIAFDDSILYLVGVSQYFKNGYVVPLNSSSTGTYTYLNTTDIAISNHDVYISGSDNGNAVYWKNGIETVLTGGTLATGIQVTNNNVVCVSGEMSVSAGHGGYNTYAVYWKNGNRTNLGSGNASDIAVQDTDVYVVGYQAGKAVYWKNGIKTELSSNNSSANKIIISGSDLYIAGTDNGAKYWKNGVLYPLNYIDYTTYVSSLFIDGNDVYVSGNISGKGWENRAVYWKNGQCTVLPFLSETYSSTDICVK